MGTGGSFMSEGFDHTSNPNGKNARSSRERDVLRPHLASLRPSVADTPDFTRSVLTEVGRHRSWLDSRERWWVWIGRVGAAAAVVAVAAGVFLVQRNTDIESVASAPDDRPIGQLVRSVSSDSQRVDVRAIDGVAISRAVIAEPLARAMRSAERSQRTASVWAIQRIGAQSVMRPMSVAITEDGIVGQRGYAVLSVGHPDQMAPNQMFVPDSGSASEWSGSMVVPAAFQSPARRSPAFPPGN